VGDFWTLRADCLPEELEPSVGVTNGYGAATIEFTTL